MKKNVLVILQQYKPFSSPTCICFENVINALRSDFNVYILTNDYKDQNESNNSNVFRVKPFLLTRLESKKKKNKFLIKVCHLFGIVSNLFLAWIYPNTHPVYSKKFCKKASQVCKTHKIDIVIPVCFSIDNLYAGLYAKKHNDIELCPYIIDSLSSGKTEKYLPARYCKNRRIKFEKELFKYSSSIFLMKTMYDFAITHFPVFISKMHFIDPPFYLKSKNRIVSDLEKHFSNKYINLVYTGYLYLPDRNPLLFKKAFEGLDVQIQKKLHIIVAGKNRCETELKKLLSWGGIKITYLGFVNHDDAKFLIDRADILLNFGTNNETAVSGKIFEYMASRKPIFSFCPSSNDLSLSYLRKYPLHYLYINNGDSNPDDISNFIVKNTGTLVDPCVVDSICEDAKPDAILRWLK